ncbi:MAG: glycosyltransferase family 4 protein [Candidatus Saccharibacteria bacterium]|nr:glycosyltransferase family 4 protein [Candidatus Saccharibacteria bacterium]
MKKPISVNLISESEFTVKGHGVHTAYVEMREAMKKCPDIKLYINDKNAETDIIHIHTMGLYSANFLHKKHGKKVVSGHLVPDSFVGSIIGAKYWKPLGAWWLKRFYKQADLVLACSGLVKTELTHNMKLNNVDILYNSINTEQYHFTDKQRKAAREKLGIKNKEFVIIGNGQVQPRKRCDILIDLAKQLPNVRFFWVGGIPFKGLGDKYHDMQQLIKSAPKNMTITGVIPLEDVKQYYAAADLFILPAEQENHPMCVIEAAASSLPIILRDIPNYKDTFKNDVMLAKTDADFMNLVKKAIDNPDLLAEYRQKSAKIAQRFDSQTAINRLLDFYRQLLK